MAPTDTPGSSSTNDVPHDNILLESGTNELEVLIFGLGDQSYGVNVAKVREVILPTPVSASPGQPPDVMGMFNLRGVVLPLVDLHSYFDITPITDDTKSHRIIVTEFNGAQAAFKVERVEQIHRMTWQDIRSVPEETASEHMSVTGIAELGDKLILMLDFESIRDQVSLQNALHITKVENELGVNREGFRVYLAEDSRFIRNIMVNVLTNSGYTNVTAFTNGQDCWDAIDDAVRNGKPTPDILATDIEMPQMDGLHLTRKIRATPSLENLPIVLFSSLITDDTRHKGEACGANQQIAKPELPKLVQIIDGWVHKQSTADAA
jgi:two-component system, chemotaxis family, chemotaxis protein CheV